MIRSRFRSRSRSLGSLPSPQLGRHLNRKSLKLTQRDLNPDPPALLSLALEARYRQAACTSTPQPIGSFEPPSRQSDQLWGLSLKALTHDVI